MKSFYNSLRTFLFIFTGLILISSFASKGIPVENNSNRSNGQFLEKYHGDFDFSGLEKFAPCDQISSTLPCSQIGVLLPFSLSFTGDEGGLEDGATSPAQTGFTMVQKPSAILSGESSLSLPGVDGYAPSRLAVSAGKLIITPTKGIFFRQPSGNPSSANTNSQLNALGVGYIPSNSILNIEVELDQPNYRLSAGTNTAQQGGIWYGLDEDHILKIVSGKNGAEDTQRIQLQVEDLTHPTVASRVIEINTPTNFSIDGISVIKLRLEINPVEKKVTGFYSLDGANEINVGEIPLRDLFFDGVDHDEDSNSGNLVYSGVFSSLRNAALTSDLTFSFDNFSISEVQSSENDILDFSFSEQTGAATIDVGTHTVSIEVENGSNLGALVPTISVSTFADINPASGEAQDFSVPVNYSVTAEDETPQVWTVTVTEAAPPLTKFIENFDTYGTGVLTAVGSVNWEKENGTGEDIPLNATGITSGTTHSISFTEGPHTTDYKLLQGNPIAMVSGVPFYFATYFKVTSLATATNRIRTAIRIDDDLAGDDWVRLQIARNVDQLIARVGLAGSGSDNGNVNIDSDQLLQFIVKGVWNGTDQISYEWSIAPKLNESSTIWTSAGTHATVGTPEVGRLFISSVGTNDGLVGPIRFSTDYSEVVTEDLNPVITEDPYEAKINFQNNPSFTTPPTGYSVDYGQAFGSNSITIGSNSFEYGWKLKSSGLPIDATSGGSGPTAGVGRNRFASSAAYNAASDQGKLEGTLVHFQGDNIRANSGGALSWGTDNRANELFWEIEIPNGIYEVTLGLGDFGTTAIGNIDSRHSATVEGFTIIPAFEPTTGLVKTESMIVEVTDGFLTITGEGGYNSKITHIEISESTGTPVSGILAFDPATISSQLQISSTSSITSTLSGSGASSISLIIDDLVNLKDKNVFGTNEWLTIQEIGVIGENSFDISSIDISDPNGTTFSIGDLRNDKVIATAKGFKPAILELDLEVIEPASSEKAFLTFQFGSDDAIIDSEAFTVGFEVPNGTDVTALSPTFTLSEGATSDPVSGVSVDFTNPVTYTVTAEDGTTQDWIVTVTIASVAPKTEKAILAFELAGAIPAVIDAEAFTVDFEVPFGTDVTALAPTFTLSDGATSSPASNEAVNFENPVNYLVTAEDGTTQEWVVTVTVGDEVITPFEARINFQDDVVTPPAGFEIDFGQAFGTKTVAVGDNTFAYGWKLKSTNEPFDASNLAAGNNNGVGRNRLAGAYGAASDVEKLEGTLVHFQGDNIRNNNGTSGWPNQPRANELVWEIEIPNGIYEVTLSLGDQGTDVDSRHSATVEGFTVVPAFVPTPSENRNGTMVVAVNDGLLTVTGEGGYNSKINYITIVPSTGTPVSGELVFDPLTIDTTLSPDQTSTFTATLLGVDAGDIGLVIDDVINGVDKNDTDSNDWLALPAVGSLGSLEFASSATGFTVGTTRTNTIIATATGFKPASLIANLEVIEPASSEKAILTYQFGSDDAIIDSETFTVGFEVPNGTDVTALTPTFTLSEGATSSLASGVTVNFTSPVTYTVTAEDGTTQDWIVTVTIESVAPKTEKAILAFELAGSTPAVIDAEAFTVDFEVPFGTDVTALAPIFTLSDGATSSPASGDAVDFTNPVTYTVTAEDGTTQEWVVTVTVADAPELPCSPYSLLPCDQITSSLPVNLTFDGTQGGLEDINSSGTGFTMVDPHSATRVAADGAPTYPAVNGFEPSKLNVTGGNLVMTASKGIAFLTNNAQINSLGVGLQNISAPIIIETKLLGIVTGLSSAQAGIWFGIDEDNFVKLNLNQNNRIEVRKELNGLSNTVDNNQNLDQIQITTTASGDDITLRMVVDPVEMTITSFYAINDGPLIQVTKTGVEQLALPALYLSGKQISSTDGNASFAGIYSTYRNNNSSFDATFDYFTIEEEEIVVPKILTFSQAELNFTGEVGSVIPSQFVDLIASEGTPTVVLSDDPDTGAWLTLPTDPAIGNLEFGINTSVPAGVYSTTVFAIDQPEAGYENGQITINLTLTDPASPTVDLKVNFSDPLTVAPAGYIRDSGDSYADRGNGYSYGWLDASSSNPADLTKNGRNRAVAGVSVLDNTLIHMQYGNVSTNAANGYLSDAKWEVEVPNGTYTVLVAVGDPNVDGAVEDTPFHTIVVEGTTAIDRYEATGVAGSATRGTTGTVTVNVSDGKLTLAPGDGFNTKIRYVEITTGGTVEPQTPRVLGANPADGATNVPVVTSISANNLFLPNGGGLDNSSITFSTVKLTKQGSSTLIPFTFNGTGGGDAISLVPTLPLEANTTYVFEINGVKDNTGVTLEIFTSTFTTGDGGSSGPTTDLDNVSFTKFGKVGSTGKYATLVIGPDGLLYGLDINGDIKRWTINADGTLGNEAVLNDWKTSYSSRAAIGFVFDPASSAGNLIAYITHQSAALSNAPDWDGKISKLTGANLETEQLLVTDLPRSLRDHLTNSLAFRPSEASVLYFNQGSNSAAGALDGGWQKEERMLSGATLRLDLTKLPATLPLNVRTTDNIQAIIAADVNSPILDGFYNPYYVNAPLTIFASGIRNAYDLVWHSNGQLYVPANGTAAGGKSPASINGMRRPNGTFYDTSGEPDVYPSIQSIPVVDTQRDWLFRVNPSEPIGYYGHPNPLRGEFVLNRGDIDDDNSVYNGVSPDVNYRGAAFDFEFNKSPNGVIEYKSNAENGNLQGALLVVRYSGGSDIIALVPNGPNGDIQTSKIGIPGFTGFTDPLDLIEDVNTGNIYVSDYGRSEIVLLKPSNQASPKPVIILSTEEVIGDAESAGSATYSEEILLSNLGNASLTNIGFNITGNDASQFSLTGLPTFLNTQNTGSFTVSFDPTSNGPKTATLTITGMNADPVSIPLRGLGKAGIGGGSEPSLQWILDTHLGGEVINVGDIDPTNNIITTGSTTNYNSLIGDEVDIQAFQRSSDGPVEIEVLSIYGPTSSNPVVAFGWYLSGDNTSVQEVFTVSNSPTSNGQTLNPVISGTLEFDPGNGSFGFVSRWPAFADRQLFSEDILNNFSGAIPHHVRVYALPGEDNAYIIATEEHISGFDYQDIVVIVRNVMPFTDVPPTEGCSPISTLDCADIDVTLPFSLTFSGSEGGLSNTGFTMVDNPSARIAIDGPISNPNVPGFEPSKLTVADGNLTINANNGISFVTNGTGTGFSSDVNSQINTLGAGFDASAYGNFSISTTVVEQFDDASADAEQGGLWFGLNEDNFVKLIVDNAGRVELRSELAATSVNADQQITAAIPGIKTSDVSLRLYVDIENNLLTGYYSINSGAEVEVGSLPLPSIYISGNASYNNLSFAGVFASKRRELVADVNYSFSDFSIIPENDPVVPTFGPLNINFSTAADAAPLGYERDSGSPFGDRGNGYSYGWLNTDGVTPLDLSANTRNRDIAGADFLQKTIIHMQYQNGVPPGGTPNGTQVEGIWEVDVPNGTYEVTIGVGDLGTDGEFTLPSHTVNVEGVNAVSAFVPTGNAGALTRVTSTTVTVNVTDGKLTIDAAGGFNTKIHALEITQTSQSDLPFFTSVNPSNNATNVRIEEFQISVAIDTPLGYELDLTTVDGNVKLFEVTGSGNVEVPTNSNDTGGGDAITLTPISQLKENTEYVFSIVGVEANRSGDLNDRLTFISFESRFTTGTLEGEETPERDLTGVEFTKVAGGASLGEGTVNERFSSLAIGPDGKLYGSTIGDFQSDGKIFRWDMASDGTLENLEILSPVLSGSNHPVTGTPAGNDRLIIGFAFDPNATAENLVAYITHSVASESAGPEWDGKLTKLSGPNLETVEDLIIHLPRSSKDHLTNSLTFDPAGFMYITQGSNSAGGNPDPSWSNRPERLLSAAILKVDLSKLTSSLPLSAYTTDDISVINTAPSSGLSMSNGTYNPYSSASPLTIFASGVRNAYDLVWHSNGWLYIPTNGTAGNNNNSPNSPSTSAYSLARRIDGLTSIPDAPALIGGETQKDWLFKTRGGSYHGHPNPFRGEFVLNHGGLPYSGVPGQVDAPKVDVNKYPRTLGPDPNYRQPAYDFGFNKSPNGVIEYKSDAFGGKLQGLLMVVRFSGQDDIIVMDPASNGDIAEAYTSIPGMSGFDDPLDLVEDPKTGNIYVSEYDRGAGNNVRLTLLRAAIPATLKPELEADPEELIFEIEVEGKTVGEVPYGNQTDSKTVEVTNSGTVSITISSASIEGDVLNQFNEVTPSGSTTLDPGQSVSYTVTFAPALNSQNLGYHTANLVLATDSQVQPEFTIGLHALKKNGFEGGNEPPLQAVVNTLGFGINVGWTQLAVGVGTDLKGEEVLVQQWVKAGPGNINITPVGRYSPAELLPFGWYTNSSGTINLNQVGALASDLENAQTLYPEIASGDNFFDPSGSVFGLYVDSNTFNRTNYTEDDINTGGVARRARTYPMKDRAGNLIPNSYLVAFEDASNGDYQDYIFVIDNVIPYEEGLLTMNFIPSSLNISSSELDGNTVTQQVTLDATGPLTGSEVTLTSNATWINLPSNITIGTPFDLVIDKVGLAFGTYQGKVTATAPGYPAEELNVRLTVTAEPVFTYQFNFQSNTAPYVPVVSPNGWTDDFGVPFGQQGDLKFGWVVPGTETPASAAANGRNRNTGVNDDPLLKTFTIIGHRTAATFPLRDWLVELPNGTYTVNISVGDGDFADSYHKLDVNGVTVIDYNQQVNPLPGTNQEATATVEVTNGIMRLSLASGGVNAKPNYIRIAPFVVSAQAPLITTTFEGLESEAGIYRGEVTATVEATDRSESEDGIVRVEYSLNGSTLSAYAEPINILIPGDYELLVEAEDGNGNVTSEVYSFTVEALSGALLEIENMTKVPGTQRSFPADDYYTFYRFRNPGQAAVHDANVMKLKNNGTGDLVIDEINLSTANDYTFTILPSGILPTELPLTIPAGGSRDIQINFISNPAGGNNAIIKRTITILSNADNGIESVATLHGGFAPQPEGGDEIDAQEVFDAFGFTTSMRSAVNDAGEFTGNFITRPSSNAPIPANVDAGYEGDLILSSNYVQADPTQPVRGLQLSALHGGPGSNGAQFVQPIEVGNSVVGGINFSHGANWYQTLLPKSGGIESTTINADFANTIAGSFRIAIAGYSSAGGNNISGGRPDLTGLRVYKAIDREGNVIPNEYIALQDFVQTGCGAGSANCDWNDNTFYFINIRPEAVPTAETLENLNILEGVEFSEDLSGFFDKGYPGNKLFFSLISAGEVPAWLTISESGLISGTAPADAESSYVVEVIATDYNGLIAGSPLTISVDKAPVAIAEANVSEGRAPLTVSFTGENSTDEVEIASYEWFFEDGATANTANAEYTFTVEGEYEVILTVTDINGLSDSETLSIAAISAVGPKARATSDVVSGQTPLTVSFDGSTSDSDVAITDYEWEFETGQTSTDVSPSYTFNESGEYPVTLTVTDANGLTDQTSLTVTVAGNVGPEAIASADVLSGDVPLTVSFTGSNSTDDLAVVSYAWNFGDAGTSDLADPTVIFTEIGNYPVTLTVTDAAGLTSVANLSITVNEPAPEPNFELRINAGGPQVTFEGNVFAADNSFVGGKVFINSSATVPELYQSERSASPPTFGYEIPVPNGTYTVNLHFAEIFFGATGGGSGGSGARIFDVLAEGEIILDNFDINAEVGSQTATVETFEVVVNDGVLNLNFSALAAVGGVNQPKLSALEVIGFVDINEAPVAVASATPETGEAPLEVVFSAVGSTDDEAIVTYTWNFGDGSPESNEEDPTHIYTSVGEYTATLTVEDEEGLTNSATVDILVTGNEAPSAVASATPETGFAPLEVVFSSLGSSDDEGIVTYTWNFGDGSVESNEENPTHIYTEVGEYTASLTVEDVEGLTNSATVVITVTEEPVDTGFSLYLNTGSAANVEFDSKLFIGDLATPTLYNSTHTYANLGASNIALYQTERGSQADLTTLTFSIPVPNGIYTVSTYHNEMYFGKVAGQTNAIGKRVFDILIEGNLVKDNLDLFAESGGNPIKLTFNEVIVTDGVLNISMPPTANRATISGLAIDKIIDDKVDPVAVAEATPNPALVEEEVSFTGSNSTDDGELTYLWDFGDGTISAEADPKHTYDEAGLYEVTLTVIDGDANFDITTISVEVNLPTEPEPDFSMYLNTGTSSSTLYEGRMFVGDQSTTSTYYNSTSTRSTASAGLETLFKTARTSSSGTLSYSIPVPNGVYTITTYHTEQYFGLLSAGGAGKRRFDISLEGVKVRENLDLYQEGGNGAVVQVFEEVTVFDGLLTLDLQATVSSPLVSGIAIEGNISQGNFAPKSVFTYSPTLLINTETQVVFNSSESTDDAGIVSYAWDFGDGTTSDLENPTHAYAVSGSYTVTFTVTDEEGLSDSSSAELEVVDALPELDFSMYLNTGTSSSTVYEGRMFVGDQSTPSTYYNNSSTRSTASAGLETLFKTARTSSSGTLSYSIPVPNGVYTVTTYHTEQYFGVFSAGGAGKRRFDISLEGVKVRENLDLYQEGGNGAVVQVFEEVTVFDGLLTLDLEATVSSPVLSGIAIEGNISQGNFAPKSVFTYSPTLLINAETPVVFNSSESTDDAGIVSYAWDFGDGTTSDLENPTHAYAGSGSYTVTFTVTDEEGLSDSSSAELEVVDALPELDFSMYLNTGTSSSTVYEGRMFVGDQSTPSTYYNNSSTRSTVSAGLETLFKTARTSSSGTLSYSIPVPNGVYTVTTYHTEQYFGVFSAGGAGKRRFDISLEGVKVRENLDLYQEGGNGAVVQVFEEVTVLDGLLTLDLEATVSSPLLSGIAIEGFTSSTAARILAHPTILASPMEGSGPLKVDFMGDLTGVDQGNLSYSYEFGDGINSSEKNPSHMFVTPGEHEVKVTVRDGKELVTQETITIQVNKSNEAGFNTDSGFGKSSIRMYPNPASDLVNLQSTNPEEKLGEISIFDVRGRMVQTYLPEMVENGNKYTISVRSLAAGVYFLTTTTEAGVTELQRLIVVK